MCVPPNYLRLFALLLALVGGFLVIAYKSADASYPISTGMSEVQNARGAAAQDAQADCWNIIPSPNPGPGSNYLTGVSILTATDIWAVGRTYENARYNTVILHWDGTQWSTVPSPNPGLFPRLESVLAIAPNNVWAVGSFNESSGSAVTTLIMHWDGTAWSIVFSPNAPLSNNNYLLDVDAVGPEDIWAVGYYTSQGGTYTLTLHWNGISWSYVPSPTPEGSYHYGQLSGVTAISSNDIWAVGGQSVSSPPSSLILHWDGTAWTITPSPNAGTGSNYLFDVTGISANDIWAVGYFRNNGLRSTLTLHWDGTIWRVVPSPNPELQHSFLRGVGAVSSNEVWAAGYYLSTGGYFRAFTMRWDGLSWSVLAHPTLSGDQYLESMDAAPIGEVWAVGYTNSAGMSRTLIEHFSTSCPALTSTATPAPTRTRLPTTTPTAVTTCPVRWDVVSSPNVGTESILLDVSALSATDVWAVGHYGSLEGTLTMHWDGMRWTIVPSPSPGSGFNTLKGVIALAPDNVWAVGTYKNGYDTPDATLTIHWDGNAWTVVPSPNPGPSYSILSAVDAVSPSDVWAVGVYRDASMRYHQLVMRWDGSGWNVLTLPETASGGPGLIGVAAISGSDVWAISYSMALHWDGAQWTIVDTPHGSVRDEQLRAISATSSDDVWIVGEYFDVLTDLYKPLVLRWDGTRWVLSPGPDAGAVTYSLQGIDALTADDVWVVGYQSDGYGPQVSSVAHWDGGQWNVTVSPGSNSYNVELRAIAALSGTDVWAVGDHRIFPSSTSRTLTTHYASVCGCLIQFSDVPQEHTFYQNVRCLACRNIVSGYACGSPDEPCDPSNNPYYRPGNNVTRGQLSKIVASAADFIEPVPASRQTFEDVPSTNAFWPWIERLASRGVVGGYACGGVGEPCNDEARPYFRWSNNATRGQISKIVAVAANLENYIPPDRQTFEDVPSTYPFWLWIENLSNEGVIGGYACGGQAEPCMPGNRPYFRPANNTTRGQMAKIAANGFYPGCVTPER